MREVGVEGRWRPLGRGRVGDAVSGGRRRHEGAPEGWSAGGPSPPETGAAPLRKTRIWGKDNANSERWACLSRSGSTPRKPETVTGVVLVVSGPVR